MNIIALDLANQTGYAEYTQRRGIKWQTWKLRKGREESDLMIALENAINAVNPSLIVYEMAAFQRGHAGPPWHRKHGVLMAMAQDHGIKLRGIHQGTWKKHIVGFANFGKPSRKADFGEYEALKALQKRGYDGFKTFDEVDAVGVLLTAMETDETEKENT